MRKRVGRPLGMRLSEESRRKIAIAKTGQKHSQETKDKIRNSVINYYDDKGRIKAIIKFFKDNIGNKTMKKYPKIISLSTTEEMRNELVKLAEEDDRNISYIIRKIIDEHLNKEKIE